jgi:hypothetical protein
MRFLDYLQQQQARFDSACHVVLLAKFDANETAFLERELTFVRSKIFTVQYTELRARTFIPLATDIPPWADTHTYKVNDRTGKARVGSYQSKDIPRVDIQTREVLTHCVPITDAFAWNIDEMRKAAALGVPLQENKASAARMAIETSIDEILALGDLGNQTGLSSKGFLNNADVVSNGIVNPASDPWDGTTTADQMLADLNSPVNTIVQNSNNVFIPDTYILPPKTFNLAAQKRIGVDSSMTVLQFFLATNPYIKNVDQWTRCTGAGAGGSTSRAVIYKRDPAVLEGIVNQEFEALPPETKGFEFEVPCHAKCGGTVIYQPLAVRYMDIQES